MLRRLAEVAFLGTAGATISSAKNWAIKQSHAALFRQDSAFTRAPQSARSLTIPLQHKHFSSEICELRDTASPTPSNRLATPCASAQPAAIEDKDTSHRATDYKVVLEVDVHLDPYIEKKRAYEIKAEIQKYVEPRLLSLYHLRHSRASGRTSKMRSATSSTRTTRDVAFGYQCSVTYDTA